MQHTAAASHEEPQADLSCWDRQGREVPCDSSTFHPSTAAWSDVCMWPHRSEVAKWQVSSSMFSLVDGQAAACAHKHQTVVYTIHGLETHLKGSKLKLAPYTALILDSTCTEVHIADVTISGALPCCTLCFAQQALCSMIYRARAVSFCGFVVYADLHACARLHAYRRCIAGGIVVCSGTGCSVTFTNTYG